MSEVYDADSPRWSWPTKLVVSLSIVAIIAGLVMRFRTYVGPMLLAIILAYLSYPIAEWMRTRFKISWRLAVGLFYLILVLILIGILTLGGIAIVEQATNLYTLIETAITEQLPDLLNNLSQQTINLGFFTIDLTHLQIENYTNQILSSVQPLLGEVGTLLRVVATSAAGFLGWVAFVLIIAYFITSESGGIQHGLIRLDLPGYSFDMHKLSLELKTIWNTFLRGQLVLFFLTAIIYSVVLSVLGLRYSLGLAFLAGFGRFLPYVGPTIAWTTYVLVALFQGTTIFGLSPVGYAAVILGIAVVVDMLFDNFISPKFLGETLKVHPAAVLIAALIAANLIGVVGVLLAAPVLATIQLLGRYAIRKLFDLDPWEGISHSPPIPIHAYIPVFLRRGWGFVWEKIVLFWERIRTAVAKNAPRSPLE